MKTPALFMLTAALALAVASAAEATAVGVQVTVSPRDALWFEPVTLTVTGSGCGNELAAPRLVFQGGWSLEVGLRDLCDIVSPAIPVPFSFSTTFGPPLTPAPYTVRVLDLASRAELAETSLTVHPAADLRVVPSPVVTSAAPANVSVQAVASCPSVEAPDIDGKVIRLDYSAGCNILPPPPAAEEILVPIGPLPPGTYRLQVVELGGVFSGGVLPMATAELVVHDAAGCVPGDETLCLEGGRFRVEVRWRDFADHSGAAQAVHIPDRRDTGLFWFFDPDNVELTVKVLDGCGVNGRHWVFISSGSTVEHTVTVTDTKNGTVRDYHNALGHTPSLVADTTAFADCP